MQQANHTRNPSASHAIDLDLRREVNRRSAVVQSAGIGLCALAELLGADGSEHHMTEELTEGVASAVLAIGALMNEIGLRLWEISEEEQQ
ncbi:hypothetical protein [Pseudomonas sp. D(2018)]|uniref:hypothetical protein n=1 Tax=Pseudomonas sp. D(2018) TaxID=2502238 RepID=UPI0010F78044|nr:hypothetical protein [Pseudomonas sp. D(2018)]